MKTVCVLLTKWTGKNANVIFENNNNECTGKKKRIKTRRVRHFRGML